MVHLQYALFFQNQQYFNVVYEWIKEFDIAGFLDVAATVDKCIQYCKKEKNFIEIGNEATVKFQGKRSDLETVFHSVEKKGLNQTLF
jgi:hypothetical protein